MTVKLDTFDSLVREKMGSYEQDPPPGLWEKIAAGAALGSVPRSAFPWVRVAASLALLVVAGFSFWYFSLYLQEMGPLPGETARIEYLEPARGARLEAAMPTLVMRETGRERAAAWLDRRLGESLPEEADPTTGSIALLPPVMQAGLRAGAAWPPLQPRHAVVEPDRLMAEPLQLASHLTKAPGRTSGFSMSAWVAPQHNYRVFSDVQGNDVAMSLAFDELEEKLYTLSYGLSAAYAVSPRWAVQSGIHYIHTGQYLHDIRTYAASTRSPLFEPRDGDAFLHPQDVFSSLGEIRLNDVSVYLDDVTSSQVFTRDKEALEGLDPASLNLLEDGLVQRFSFLEIPLVLRYQVIHRRVGLALKAGVAGHVLLDNGVFMGRQHGADRIGETVGIRDFQISAMGGLAFSVPLASRIHLVFEPTAQFYLQSFSMDETYAVRTYPYSFAVYTGLTYRF